MGAYIWGLCPPSSVVTAEFNGENVLLGRIRYLYKPYGFMDDRNARLYSRHGSPIEKSWENRITPTYVAVGEHTKHTNDATVLQWRQGQTLVVDDPNWGGMKVVGFLKIEKQGRKNKYIIIPNIVWEGLPSSLDEQTMEWSEI